MSKELDLIHQDAVDLFKINDASMIDKNTWEKMMDAITKLNTPDILI